MNEYDAIVIGVGGMGSASVYHLARRGWRVLGLEQFDVPHEMGSSHGYSRMIRYTLQEHPSYVPLVRRAYELWHQLENAARERLLVTTGSIRAGHSESEFFQGAVAACEQHHIPYEVLTGRRDRQAIPRIPSGPRHIGRLPGRRRIFVAGAMHRGPRERGARGGR